MTTSTSNQPCGADFSLIVILITYVEKENFISPGRELG